MVIKCVDIGSWILALIYLSSQLKLYKNNSLFFILSSVSYSFKILSLTLSFSLHIYNDVFISNNIFGEKKKRKKENVCIIFLRYVPVRLVAKTSWPSILLYWSALNKHAAFWITSSRDKHTMCSVYVAYLYLKLYNVISVTLCVSLWCFRFSFLLSLSLSLSLSLAYSLTATSSHIYQSRVVR